MCDGGGAAAAQQSAPRPAEGTAVDPIALEPVDDVVVTMLMDNSYDGLMAAPHRAAGPGSTGCRPSRHPSRSGGRSPG